MALTLDEVRRIAALARLRFTPDEEAVLARQLAAIVAYVDRLAEVPAGDGGEAAPATPREAADVPREGLPRELFLANAPAARDGFLRVPEVLTGATGEAADGADG